jgi:hypothetical protein
MLKTIMSSMTTATGAHGDHRVGRDFEAGLAVLGATAGTRAAHAGIPQ